MDNGEGKGATGLKVHGEFFVRRLQYKWVRYGQARGGSTDGSICIAAMFSTLGLGKHFMESYQQLS